MKEVIVTEKKEGENATSLYRRFVKQYRSSGIQTATKKNRFCDRKPSKSVRKKECLNRLVKKGKYDEAFRLGKITSIHKK